MAFEVRSPAGDEEFVALMAALGQSFGFPPDAGVAYRQLIGDENHRVVLRDGSLLGGLAIYPMAHWFGGSQVPTAGIAAVGVRPDARGQGVARALMAEVLREQRAAGVALSTLYASTQVLYRSVGYEQAGHRVVYKMPLSWVTPGPRTLAVNPVDPNAVEALAGCYSRWVRTQSGPLERSRAIWTRMARGELVYGVTFGDPAQPEGYLVWQLVKEQGAFYNLVVRDRVALTPEAARMQWTVLADHRSMARTVTFAGPARDPWLGLPSESHPVEVARYERWMLRVLDVGLALRARGWNPSVNAELHLEITDDLFPENSGRLVLSVQGGRGEVWEGGRGEVALDVRGLSALYTGLHSARELAGLGWLRGDEGALQRAEAMFAGPAPWMPDHF